MICDLYELLALSGYNYGAGKSLFRDNSENITVPVIITSAAISSGKLEELLLAGFNPLMIDPRYIKSLNNLITAFDFKAIYLDEVFRNNHPYENLQIKQQDLQEKETDLFPCIYFYTSGSTALPRIVVKSVDNLLSEAKVLKGLFNFNAGDIILSSVSLYHIYGFLFSYLMPKVADADIMISPSLSDTLKKLETATVWVTTPSIIKAVLPYLKKQPYTLRMSFSSGGRLEKQDALKLQTITGSKIIQIYGSTETGGIGYNDPCSENGFNLLPGVELRLTDKSEDNTGKVTVRSRYVSSSVLRPSGFQKIISDDGFLVTEDIGSTEEHKLVIKGRYDRIIKRREKRINLDYIEEMLSGTDCFKEVKTVYQNDKLFAFVVLNAPKSEEELREISVSTLPEFMLPDSYIVVENIPLLPNFKTDYRGLLKEINVT